MEFHHKNDRSIKSLVELAAQGHYPLFERSWIEEIGKNHKKLTGNEKCKIKGLFKRVSKYNSLEKKKTALFALKSEERELFIRGFIKMVENKILDTGTELQ